MSQVSEHYACFRRLSKLTSGAMLIKVTSWIITALNAFFFFSYRNVYHFFKESNTGPGFNSFAFLLTSYCYSVEGTFLVVVDESWIGDSEFHGYRLRRCYCICCCQVYSKGVEITQNSWFCIPVNYIVHSPEDRWQMLVLQSYWSRSIKNSWSFGGLFCEYKQGSRLKDRFPFVSLIEHAHA